MMQTGKRRRRDECCVEILGYHGLYNNNNDEKHEI